MSGNVDYLHLEIADSKPLAIGEKVVEVGPVGPEIVGVENRTENLLHVADVLADRDSRARFRPEERGCGQVVGMGVGFQHPVDRQPRFFGRGEDCLCRADVGGSRSEVEIEHRIDDRGAARRFVPDEVADRIGRFVEEGLNDGFGGHGMLQFA